MDKGKKQGSSFQPEVAKKQPRQSVPKVLSTGRSKSDFRGRQGVTPHMDLVSRELEELRFLSIGSPVPTPRAEEGEDLFGSEGASSSSSSSAAFRPGPPPFPLIKVDSCEGGSSLGEAASGAEAAGEVVRRGLKGGRRNSDTLTTPSYVPRSTGSKVVRYTFRGSEDAVSD